MSKQERLNVLKSMIVEMIIKSNEDTDDCKDRSKEDSERYETLVWALQSLSQKGDIYIL